MESYLFYIFASVLGLFSLVAVHFLHKQKKLLERQLKKLEAMEQPTKELET